jgi:hypothetical protein
MANKNTANKHLSDFVEKIKVAPANVNQKYFTAGAIITTTVRLTKMMFFMDMV